MNKKWNVEIDESDLINILCKEISWKINHREIRESLVKAVGIILKDKDIERYITKASEKAIKDIAKWKLMQDYIQMKQENEVFTQKVDTMIENFNLVMKEIQEYKTIMETLQTQYEAMKP